MRQLLSGLAILVALVVVIGESASAQLMPSSNWSNVCALPWGGILEGGSSVTAYSQTLPAGACSSYSETRSCAGGMLSGSYANQSCTNGCTGTPWGSVSSGYSNTAYSSTTPAGPCSSYAETRTCTNGTMSGSYTNTSCNSGCTGTPWGSVSHGYSNTAYSTSQVACGSSCSSYAETRTCSNGTMSGSYTITSCSVAACYTWVAVGNNCGGGGSPVNCTDFAPGGTCTVPGYYCNKVVSTCGPAYPPPQPMMYQMFRCQ